MSNSPLVSHINISPNKTSPRNHKIDTITIHCVVGQVTVERLGEIFKPTSRNASSNYGIGKDGRVGMYVEECDRSFCSSNAANDHRSITIEVASDTTHPYAVNDIALNSLIDLLVDICKRNDIKKLVWSENKNDRVNHLNGCNMTVHRDYAAKSCPGDYLYNKHSYIANEVNRRLTMELGNKENNKNEENNEYNIIYHIVQKGEYLSKIANMYNVSVEDIVNWNNVKDKNKIITGQQLTIKVKKETTQTKEETQKLFNKNNYTNEEFINFVGKIAVEDYVNHPILPSITIAQAIKESGWGKSELAQNANALFGIKKNGWQGETYIKQATEQKLNGEYYTVDNVEWRKYKDWEESIKDHGEYLCTRKVGNQQYPNWYKLIGEKDLNKAIYYLQNATYKYATSQTYETSLKNDYINKYNLTKFDDMVLNNEEIQEQVGKVEFKPYLIVKNCNSFLRIRKEPHTGATITGYLKNNITRYTIVEEKDGWGRLKSGIGWIHLDFVKKVDK